MTQREKTLAIGIGAAAVLLGGMFVVVRISAAFEERNKQLTELQLEKSQKESSIRAGERAVRKLKDFEQQSLPGDATLAGSLYSQWLLKQTVETGFATPHVSLGPARPRGDIFVQHSFLIDGQADLGQLCRFLYRFYSAGFLHRVGRMTLVPVSGKRTLDIKITVEALSLKGAPNPKELTPPPSDRLAGESVDAYIMAVASRNLLGNPNQPPRIVSVGTQRGNPGRPLSFSVKGSDPDPLDSVTYDLDGNGLEGATINARTGEFRWTPKELGSYEVAVRVTDDGIPARSVVEKIKISVAEPERVVVESPRKLDFDPAQHSTLSAILQSNGKWQIWVLVRTEGKTLRLEEGDQISLGSLNAVVSSIRPDEAVFALQDGGNLTVRIGDALVSAG